MRHTLLPADIVPQTSEIAYQNALPDVGGRGSGHLGQAAARHGPRAGHRDGPRPASPAAGPRPWDRQALADPRRGAAWLPESRRSPLGRILTPCLRLPLHPSVPTGPATSHVASCESRFLVPFCDRSRHQSRTGQRIAGCRGDCPLPYQPARHRPTFVLHAIAFVRLSRFCGTIVPIVNAFRAQARGCRPWRGTGPTFPGSRSPRAERPPAQSTRCIA